MENNKQITIQDLESKLWKAADTLRGNLSAEDYMHVVLGILTIKFINDKNETVIKQLLEQGLDEDTIDEEDLNANDAFIVPKEAKWSYIITKVGTAEIGLALDNAIDALGKANSSLRGLFTTSYNDSKIDKTKLGEVVKIFQSDNLGEHGEDVLGRIYEYFLGNFFLKRGQKGGEFYTPKSIVRLITMFLKPTKGKIYDPCCGSAGMLVQAKQYIDEIGGNINNITVYGQEYNETTWKLAKLNLVLNGMSIFNTNDRNVDEGALGEKSADTFTEDQHKGKVFDFIMANPPFNLKGWWNENLTDDSRWKYGMPNKNNANFGWLQHILDKLSLNGKAGVVLANGALTSSTGNDLEVRSNIIKANKVACIISLPDKLFFTTGIPASIWFFDNNKKTDKTLMIDAQDLGQLMEGSKKNKELRKEDLEVLTKLFEDYENGIDIDEPGLAKTVSIQDIENGGFSLSPGKYITISEKEKRSDEEIQAELNESIDTLLKLMEESKELEKDVLEAIKKIKA